MSLTRRSRNQLEWPDWFLGGSRIDWPATLKELMQESELRVEEFREEGTLVIRAELPGIDPDTDVDISVSDHLLRLRAVRREETKSEDRKGYRSEFRYGSFSRSIPLPVGATEDDVEASYVDGILEVRLPVDAEEAEARKIPVARG